MSNVIEVVRKALAECSLMDSFNGIHVDYSDQIPGEAGIMPMGTQLVGEDVLGNKKYKMNFTLYAGLHAFADYDRLSNSTFLLELSYYLDAIRDVEITEKINNADYKGEITKVQSSNALMYLAPTGDVNDGVVYQLQIQVDYTIEME